MQTKKWARGRMAVLAVVAFSCPNSPADAQVLSKWGHPVVTAGWSPYDWDETGLGHYDGWPWRVPSYSQYRGAAARQHYSWAEGHDTHVGLLANGQTPEEAPPRGAALMIVKLPAEAELWIDDTKTTQGGSSRRFVTPPLQGGRTFAYTLRVHWHIKDADLTRVEKVQVEPGKCVSVNFLSVDSWTGVRAETLEMPRKVSKPVTPIVGPTNP